MGARYLHVGGTNETGLLVDITRGYILTIGRDSMETHALDLPGSRVRRQFRPARPLP